MLANIKVSIKSLYILSFLGLFLFSCKKEKVDVNWEELNTGTSENLSAVYFTDELTGHAIGGSTWFNGLYLQTQDGGSSWTVDNFADKQLFGLHFNNQGIGRAVGIDGALFSADGEPYEEWDFYRLPRWDILRDVCFNERNEGVVVAGIAFAEGAIMVLDSNYNAVHVETFEHQLNAVCYSDDNTIHVAGYGLVMRSTDGGATWLENETSDDFYQSISFPSPRLGYMVGYNGTILKTTDSGVNWKAIRRGDAIGVSDKPFLAVHFVDEQNGYIVGEKGLCWRTVDGGDKWQIIRGLPDVDLHDVYVINNTVYIVGNEGRVFRFTE